MNFSQWKNRKPIKEILDGKEILPYFEKQVTIVLENRKVSNDRIKNLAFWVKFDVEDDYLKRFDTLLKHPRNDSSSKEIFILRYGEKEGLRRFEEKSGNCCQTEKNMIKKYGKIEGLKRWKQYKSKVAFANSEEGYIAKHGEVEGKRKFRQQCQRNAGNLTLERKIELHGEKKGKKKFDEMTKVLKKRHSLENYIKLYGEEEGTKKWESLCATRSYKNSLDYYIEKYGEEEGRKRIKKVKDNSSLEVLTQKYGEEKGYELYSEYNRKKAHTKEIYIERYGEKKGIEKWENYLKNAIRPFSKISVELFDSLDCKEAEYGYNERVMSLNKKECDILKQSNISPDFLIEDKIIEFYGDLWHGCEKFFEDDFIIPHTTMTALEKRKHDALREEIIRNKGYKLKIVWEHEYKENKEKIISDCLKFLNNNH